ncbi:MAG: methyl-accepting chemotaxis protein [bacterium]
MPTKRFLKRKKVIVSPIQRKFLMIIVVMLLLMFGFVEWDIYQTTKSLSFTISSMSIESIGSLVQSTYNVVMIKVFVFLLVVSLLGMWLSIYITHKLVGPLYRLEDEIKDIVGVKGDLTHTFRIRHKDELGSLVEALNLMIDKLRSKMKDNEEFKEEVKGEIVQALSVIRAKDAVSAEEKMNTVRHLEEIVKKIEESISSNEMKLEK